MSKHKGKAVSAFMVLLIIFGSVFLVGLANLFRGQAILGLGMGYLVEDGMIIAFSLAAIIRIIWELITL